MCVERPSGGWDARSMRATKMGPESSNSMPLQLRLIVRRSSESPDASAATRRRRWRAEERLRGVEGELVSELERDDSLLLPPDKSIQPKTNSSDFDGMSCRAE